MIPTTYEPQRPVRGGAGGILPDRPDAILVAHDELDMPPASPSSRPAADTAGTTGLRDIIAQLGNQNSSIACGMASAIRAQQPGFRLRARPRPQRAGTARHQIDSPSACRKCSPGTGPGAMQKGPEGLNYFSSACLSARDIAWDSIRGIVGLPNVGKSTLFNALTKSGIAAENFPFCTIESNSGIVPMPDARPERPGRDRQARKARTADHHGIRRHRRPGGGRPSRVRAWAISSPTSADRRHRPRGALLNNNVIHMSNSVDPSAHEIIDLELIFADLDSCDKLMQKVARNAKGGDRTSPKCPAGEKPSPTSPRASRRVRC